MYNVSDVLANNSVGTVLGADSGMNEMQSQDFYKLLVSQLSQQDPFEPVKNQDILNQINSIRSMESDQSMVESLETLVNTNDSLNLTLQAMMLQNDMVTGSGLLGKEVTAYVTVKNEDDGTSSEVKMAGTVTGVRLVDGEVNLDIELEDGKTKTIPMSDVAYIGTTEDPQADEAIS